MSEENKSIAEIGDERIKKLEALVGKLVEACEHIAEYWNRNENDGAMSDALWHIIETAETVLAEAKKMKEIPNG